MIVIKWIWFKCVVRESYKEDKFYIVYNIIGIVKILLNMYLIIV